MILIAMQNKNIYNYNKINSIKENFEGKKQLRAYY